VVLHIEGGEDLAQADGRLADQGVEQAEAETEPVGREVEVGAAAIGVRGPMEGELTQV
jgi:hypothetical protein